MIATLSESERASASVSEESRISSEVRSIKTGSVEPEEVVARVVSRVSVEPTVGIGVVFGAAIVDTAGVVVVASIVVAVVAEVVAVVVASVVVLVVVVVVGAVVVVGGSVGSVVVGSVCIGVGETVVVLAGVGGCVGTLKCSL